MPRRLARALAGLVLPVAAGSARAQHVVAGQVTVLERDGVRTTDLADAVVWLEPVGAAAVPARAAGLVAASPSAAAPEIGMRGKAFSPRVRVVPAGGAVAFPNHDPFRHNVFSRSGPSEFDLGLYERGASREARLPRAGVYPVFCDIHARMTAFVVAVPTRWVGRPGPDGRFAIADVPAGRYTLRVWHERGGQQARLLAVGDAAARDPLGAGAAGAADASVRLDARGYRHVPHRNKYGLAYGPATDERY